MPKLSFSCNMAQKLIIMFIINDVYSDFFNPLSLLTTVNNVPGQRHVWVYNNSYVLQICKLKHTRQLHGNGGSGNTNRNTW